MSGLGEPLPRLMLVTDRAVAAPGSLVDRVAEAVRGGVRLVQVREKDLPDGDLLALLEELRARLPAPVRLVVNDRPGVAWAAGVGLHLPGATPRPQRVPALWGRSVHGPEDARRALAEAAGYLLLGTIFPTASKPGHPGSGLALVTEVSRLVAPTPVFAIGGIAAERVGGVRAAGAHGVAVCRAILGAPDAAEAARAFDRALAATWPR